MVCSTHVAIAHPKKEKRLTHPVSSLGSAQLIFYRPDLVQIIYEGLPPAAKDKILTRKQVTHIVENEDSATVTCADGSTFVGSVVIGADGVYSQTREQLRQAMLRQDPQADCDEEQPYESAYRMLWCAFPRPALSPPGDACETQDKDRSLGYLAGKKRGFIFLYEKLEKPTRERVVYSEKDIERFAASFFDYPISETLLFKDVFQHKAGMANLGEGVVKNFSNNRIVLVGDACHRFTPNAALGLNNGIQDIVAVCNGIHAEFKNSEGRTPSRAALKTAFDFYHGQRLAPVKKDLRASALLTRLQAWENTWFYISARFLLVFDWFQRFTLRYVAVPNMRLAPVLNYVSADEPYVGTIAWAHPIKPKKD